jgi:hypothetical protein
MRYEGGVDSSLQLLDAQRSLYSAQQAQLQARLLRLTSLVDLYRALGGGWRVADDVDGVEASTRQDVQAPPQVSSAGQATLGHSIRTLVAVRLA